MIAAGTYFDWEKPPSPQGNTRCEHPCFHPQHMHSIDSWACRLNTFLDHLDVGDYVVDGDLETYSCKSISQLFRGRAKM